MCGIGGVIFKNTNHDKITGEVILTMLDSLYRRGPDSTGVALLHPKEENVLYVDVNYEKTGNGQRILSLLKGKATILKSSDHGNYVRAKISYSGDEQSLINELNELDSDVSVASFGQQIEVLKYLGGANNLETQFQLSNYNGQVAVGHTRMATESKVDISHSQPLCCYASKDLTIIHNGHVTNYIKLRSYYERKGYHFLTGNDSEVIAVYLVDEMKKGASLEEAMQSSITDLDGSFSYIAVTPTSVGLAKEPFGMKPMVLAETDDYIAFASESLAITREFGENLKIREPKAEEVLVWNL
ncbi:hypothetical protein [Neobacillus sp. LXY-4]|uniref:hypothetical protein n=1 Tax=Neobacillus sp. LXY-4 TaxID=3379826 RepID=UPI003EE0693E